MPFTKHCTVSALFAEGEHVWILDGINNEGFSGGPVLFGTGPAQKIMAVISGYRAEPAEIVSSARAKISVPETPGIKKNAEQRRQIVNLNSGFIIAYDIKYAIEAIHRNPVGPLRPGK